MDFFCPSRFIIHWYQQLVIVWTIKSLTGLVDGPILYVRWQG